MTSNTYRVLVALLALGLIFGLGCDNGSSPASDNDQVDDQDTQEQPDQDTQEQPPGDNDQVTDEPEEQGYLEPGACRDDLDCDTNATCYEGICVRKPTKNVEMFKECSHYDSEEGEKVGNYEPMLDEQGSPIPFDESCTGETFEEVDGDTPLTNVHGLVKVFGLEADCRSIEADVFYQYFQDGDNKGEMGDYLDTSSANPVWIAKVTVDPDTGFDPETYECFVEFTDIPTNKWLVFRTSDGDDIFKNSYQFNNYIKSEDADTVTEGFRTEINAISGGSYDLIPVTAGVLGGVQPDRGAIAGSIKDCQGRLAKNATAGVIGETSVLAYFNANISDLLPAVGFRATNKDATWTSVDHVPGQWKAVGMYQLESGIKQTRVLNFRLYENSVSIVAWRVNNPINYPQLNEDFKLDSLGECPPVDE